MNKSAIIKLFEKRKNFVELCEKEATDFNSIVSCCMSFEILEKQTHKSIAEATEACSVFRDKNRILCSTCTVFIGEVLQG